MSFSWPRMAPMITMAPTISGSITTIVSTASASSRATRRSGFLHPDHQRLLRRGREGHPIAARCRAVHPAAEHQFRSAQAVAAGAPGHHHGPKPGYGSVPGRLQAPGLAHPHAGDHAGPALGRGLARCARECRDPRRAAHGADADLHLPGADFALAAGAPAGAHRLPAGGAGVARLDRRRAALHRQCHQLRPGAVARLSTSASTLPNR